MIRTHGLGSDTYELELTVPVQGEIKSDDLPAQTSEPVTELLSATVLPLLKEAQTGLARLLSALRDVPEGNFKSRAVTRALHLQQRLTGVRSKLVECGVVQEKRVDRDSAQETTGPSDTSPNNNSLNAARTVTAPKVNRKRKSAGSESTRPKQRRKTR